MTQTILDAAPDTRWFDAHGRCKPAGVAAQVHSKTRRYFICQQPDIDYPAMHARLVKHLGGEQPLSCAEFRQRAEAIWGRLSNDSDAADITRGVGVPFLLPKAEYPDIGQAMEDLYIPAVGQAFETYFPDYCFVNHHKGGLLGKLSVVAGSRHVRLLQAMRVGPVVGWYFPALSEYSVPAAIERVAELPEDFLLAGGFDTAAALIASPELLLRTEGYPPLLWLAALDAEKEGVAYHFEAYGYNLTFNRRPHFNQVAEYWNSGLVVIG